MEMVRNVRGQLLGVMVGLALVIGGVLLSLSVMDVGASHEGDDVLHICINNFTGQARFIPAGQEPNCNDNEQQVDLAGSGVADDISALTDRVDDLETENAEQDGRIDDLEDALDAIDVELPVCLTTEDDDIVFEGCNVHIRNGEDSTETTNGTGNLIVGYNEESIGSEDRGGSHNIVVGPEHSYSSFGGLVAGLNNTISGPYASVSGGQGHVASGFSSSVSGGFGGLASGNSSSVSGGLIRTVTGDHDWRAGDLFEDN